MFLIQTKMLWGVTVLFQVNWLSGLGVTGIFFYLCDPLFDIFKTFLESEKKVMGGHPLFEEDLLSGWIRKGCPLVGGRVGGFC